MNLKPIDNKSMMVANEFSKPENDKKDSNYIGLDLENKVKRQVKYYLKKRNSLNYAISKVSQLSNTPQKELTNLLYKIFDCDCKKALKEKLIKQLYFKPKIVKKIIKYFKNGYKANEILKYLELSSGGLRYILEEAKRRNMIPETCISTLRNLYFNEKRIVKKIVKYLKKGYSGTQIEEVLGVQPKRLKKMVKKAQAIIDRENEIEKKKTRLSEIGNLYSQLGSLEEVSKKIGITRERVRQLLVQGEKYKVLHYQINRKVRFKELTRTYDRDTLVATIKASNNIPGICSALGIKQIELCKLLKHYNIDFKEYRIVTTRSRYIKKYSTIVDCLGHHPTATEMASRKEWRSVWSGIDRLWGNLDNFRKEFGIDKPQMNIHPNTLNAWRITIEKIKIRKNKKKESVLNIIREKGPVKLVDISKQLTFNRGVTNIYVNELLEEQNIVKIGRGSATKYAPTSKKV